MLFWTWINCLAPYVNNQKLPHSVKEDKSNKPWRPLPSNRLAVQHAKVLAIAMYPISVTASFVLGGGMAQSLLLVLLGYLYNDLRLGDRSAVIRNVLNAYGFTSFAAGALSVAQKCSLDGDTLIWLTLIGLVIFTTVHIQDMYDQFGDAATGRRTIPLLLGDGVARWTIVTPLFAWSVLLPLYWDVGIVGSCVVGALGVVVTIRLLTM